MISRFSVNPIATVFLVLLLSGQAFAGHENAVGSAACPRATTAWEQVANRDGVVIYNRTRAGSSLKEFKSVGLMDSPPSAVYAVLNDAKSYPSFMPYSAEVRILKQTDGAIVAYHRLALPLVDDRDYTLRSEHSKSSGPAGPVYHIHWEAANDLGPAQKPGVQRVKVCEGSWLLEPTGAGTTRATYLIYSDTGGAIPALFANSASRVAIRKVFAAIRKEAHEPKYTSAKD